MLNIYRKLVIISFVCFVINTTKAQSFLELGTGVPIQQFEHSGAKKVGTDGLGIAFEFGYFYQLKKLNVALTIQYVNTSDVFQDVNPPNSSNYTGKFSLLRINPYIGYQISVPLNKKKTTQITLEPLLGVARDISLSAEYSKNGNTADYEVNNFFSLSPTFGLRIGYQFSEYFSINIKTMFGYKIKTGNHEYYPSIYVKQPDVLVKTHFSTVSLTIIRQL